MVGNFANVKHRQIFVILSCSGNLSKISLFRSCQCYNHHNDTRRVISRKHMIKCTHKYISSCNSENYKNVVLIFLYNPKESFRLSFNHWKHLVWAFRVASQDDAKVFVFNSKQLYSQIARNKVMKKSGWWRRSRSRTCSYHILGADMISHFLIDGANNSQAFAGWANFS